MEYRYACHGGDARQELRSPQSTRGGTTYSARDSTISKLFVLPRRQRRGSHRADLIDPSPAGKLVDIYRLELGTGELHPFKFEFSRPARCWVTANAPTSSDFCWLGIPPPPHLKTYLRISHVPQPAYPTFCCLRNRLMELTSPSPPPYTISDT